MASGKAKQSRGLRNGVPIVRVFKARVRPGKEKLFEYKLRTTSTPLVLDKPGFLGFLSAGPAVPGGRDFVFVTLWADFRQMKRLFGSQWRESLLPDGYAELITSCSVEHYQLSDVNWAVD